MTHHVSFNLTSVQNQELQLRLTNTRRIYSSLFLIWRKIELHVDEENVIKSGSYYNLAIELGNLICEMYVNQLVIFCRVSHWSEQAAIPR